MWTNKLIFRSGMKNQTFQLNFCTSQEQLRLDQFTQNTSSCFLNEIFCQGITAKVGVVN